MGGDFEFEMITANLDGRQPKEEENFNGLSRVYRVGSGRIDKYLFPWLAYNKALKLQQKNNYQMIWAMMANQAGWAALKFKKKLPRLPYLLTLQEGDSEWDIWLRTFFIRPIYTAIYRRADCIQAISNFLAQRASNLGAKCPIRIIPNGINRLMAEKHRNPDGYIISVSRLVRKNGLQYLIRAMKDVDRKLVIIGAGKLEKKLKNLSVKLGLGDKVEFVGSINHEEVYNYLKNASVFVRPSLSEGLGNAFLEAMAVGVPVVATSVGGIPDFLGDGETGWFCKLKDSKSIAEKVNYILSGDNKSGVELVIENAYRLVNKSYSWSIISGQMADIFRSLVKQPISNRNPVDQIIKNEEQNNNCG